MSYFNQMFARFVHCTNDHCVRFNVFQDLIKNYSVSVGDAAYVNCQGLNIFADTNDTYISIVIKHA